MSIAWMKSCITSRELTYECTQLASLYRRKKPQIHASIEYEKILDMGLSVNRINGASKLRNCLSKVMELRQSLARKIFSAPGMLT